VPKSESKKNYCDTCQEKIYNHAKKQKEEGGEKE
jgi:hypothetical protein